MTTELPEPPGGDIGLARVVSEEGKVRYMIVGAGTCLTPRQLLQLGRLIHDALKGDHEASPEWPWRQP